MTRATGPWETSDRMHEFYTSADTELDHLEGICVVKNTIQNISDMI